MHDVPKTFTHYTSTHGILTIYTYFESFKSINAFPQRAEDGQRFPVYNAFENKFELEVHSTEGSRLATLGVPVKLNIQLQCSSVFLSTEELCIDIFDNF